MPERVTVTVNGRPVSVPAGTIVAAAVAAAGVTRFREGDRVWLYNGQHNGRNLGTGAEFIADGGTSAGKVNRIAPQL
jgi:NADPH:quinone reductase-like Zn-dependent oxidoreductase